MLTDPAAAWPWLAANLPPGVEGLRGRQQVHARGKRGAPAPCAAAEGDDVKGAGGGGQLADRVQELADTLLHLLELSVHARVHLNGHSMCGLRHTAEGSSVWVQGMWGETHLQGSA